MIFYVCLDPKNNSLKYPTGVLKHPVQAGSKIQVDLPLLQAQDEYLWNILDALKNLECAPRQFARKYEERDDILY